MSSHTCLARRLQELPRSERWNSLESYVVAEFKATLMITDEEILSPNQNYFELGLTSLGLMEIKERLEAQLGDGISTTVLFNYPTVQKLLNYLVSDVLRSLFDSSVVAEE